MTKHKTTIEEFEELNKATKELEKIKVISYLANLLNRTVDYLATLFGRG